jgi:PhzF family phenazine biosynthesis protein
MNEHLKIPIYTVDAFTDKQFKGNPAAVCLLENELDEKILQNIASEMNLSETAFLLSLEGKPISESEKFSLRWFTPKVEVPLCGHATLATSWVLFSDLGVKTKKVYYETKSGKLLAQCVDEGVLLDFPKSRLESFDPPDELLRSMGISNYLDCVIAKEDKKILIRLDNEEEVMKVKPDFEKMNELSLDDMIGVIITSQGDPPYDFISRFFAPWVGVSEDPVTGSSHTVLTPYWGGILNKNQMLAYQASVRGGEIIVRSKENDRVELIGNAQIVLKGELFV